MAGLLERTSFAPWWQRRRYESLEPKDNCESVQNKKTRLPLPHLKEEVEEKEVLSYGKLKKKKGYKDMINLNWSL